jgi:NADH-quinone oxidoreductase subunit L
MLLGALSALGQDDIKRVLAWSTVSQLGYMTGALAVGAPSAALFHLLTHAAFKALLFLAAGSVIHAVGTNLMSAMGGLRERMPVTFWTMTIGLGALAGVPPLAGFWSKDAILEATTGSGPVPRGVAILVLCSAGLTVALTAAYVVRLWRRTFFGAPRSDAARHGHEPPWAMRGPLVALAVPAALLGLAGLIPAFGARLGSAERLAHLNWTTLVALLLLLAGAAWSWLRDPAAPPSESALGRLLANAFYLDAVQDALVTRPVAALARFARRGDEAVVDGAVEGVGSGAGGLGGLLARVHAGALPRAATAVLGGAVVLAAAVAIVLGVGR